MKLKGGVVFLILAIFIFPSVSSTIIIGNSFEDVYSLGDEIRLNFKIDVESEMSDFVFTYLVCDNKKELVDKRFILVDDVKNISLELPFVKEGECNFQVDFSKESSSSGKFDVSSKISSDYTMNNKYFSPGDLFVIEGNFTKANGDFYSGNIKVEIEDIIEKNIEVNSGKFYFEYKIREREVPGEYNVIVSTLEKSSFIDEVNFGKISEKIKINSKPTFLLLNYSEIVMPGENVYFNVSLLNQAEKKIDNENVTVKIFDSKNNLVFEKNVLSSSFFNYTLSENFPAGATRVNLYSGNLFSRNIMFVRDNPNVDFEIINDEIIFVNTGNVYYEDSVFISLERENFSDGIFVNLSFDVGEEYRYPLSYTRGEYNISINDEFVYNFPITGNFVFESEEFDSINYVFVTALVVAIFLFYFVFRIIKKKIKKKSVDSEDSKVSSESIRPTMVVKERAEDEEPLKKNVFMVFIKTKLDPSKYSEVCGKYGFKLNKISENLAYIVFYEEGQSPDYKIFNFIKAMFNYSKSIGDEMLVVANKGYFEKKINLLKKFALFNREILDFFDKGIIIGDKIMQNLNLVLEKEEKIVEVMGRKIRLWKI